MSRSWEKISLLKLHVFQAIVRYGSVAEASRHTAFDQFKLHNELKSLEKMVGKPLVIRGQRQCRLTPLGKEFSAFSAEVVSRFEALPVTDSVVDDPTIVISSTHGIAREHMPSVVATFLKIYPATRFKLLSGLEYSDFDQTGCDLCISPPQNNRGDLVQNILGRWRYGLFASGSYLAENGTPESLDDLGHHKFLLFRDCWPLPRGVITGDVVTQSTNYDPLLSLAKAGVGILSLPLEDETYSVDGLHRIIPDYCSEKETLVLHYRRTACQRERIRLFVDHIVSYFRGVCHDVAPEPDHPIQ